MAKKNKEVAKNKDGETTDGSEKKTERQDGLRETFESVVVAFVLAFLFRAFEAEAFVIPTGSMAPTLFGRHKEADCEQCGFHFVIGASDEIKDEYYVPMLRIESAYCPNCRFDNKVRDAPVYKGDRILVNKFPYEFGDPQRWDVPVFKYPEEPTTNYIKRLVGLPNETIVISRGNVFREIDGGPKREILRKVPSKQKRLQIAVYDNNFQESMLHKMGWPKRWAAVERVAPGVGAAQRDALDLAPVGGWTEASGTWQESVEDRSFSIDAKKAAKSLSWLRYRHIVPTFDVWNEAVRGFQANGPDAEFDHQQRLVPHAQLISDFCGYNTYTGGNGSTKDDPFWVRDITMSCTANITAVEEGADIAFELSDGEFKFRVRVNLSNGKAKLLKVILLGTDEEEVLVAEAQCDLRGVDEFDVRFANVDDRRCFWVDDELVDFGAPAEVETVRSILGPQDGDLIPVGVAVQGASVTVSNLLIERDIYYRASKTDPKVFNDEEHSDPFALRRMLDKPDEWERLYEKGRREARFVLEDAEYLMLGDNSPRSQDSRVWPNNERGAERRHAVPRSALVGRAFYIYWPHGIPFLNDGDGFSVTVHKKRGVEGLEKTDYPDMRFPFYPNFSRMKRIR
jgi:signal peptidase I